MENYKDERHTISCIIIKIDLEWQYVPPTLLSCDLFCCHIIDETWKTTKMKGILFPAL
jgi:hypothetical protein